MSRKTYNILWVVLLLVLAFYIAPAAAFLEPSGNPAVTTSPPSGVRVYGEDDIGPKHYWCFDDPDYGCDVRAYKFYQHPFDPTILEKDSLTFNPAKIFYNESYPISADSTNANEKVFLRGWYEPDHKYSKPDEYHSRGVGDWRNVNGTIELEHTYMLVDRQDELPLSGHAGTTSFVLPIAESPNQAGLSAIENIEGIPDKTNVVNLVDVHGYCNPESVDISNNTTDASDPSRCVKTTDGLIRVEKTYTLAVGETVQFFDHKLMLVGIVKDSNGDYWSKVKVWYAGNKDDDSMRTTVLGKFDVSHRENPKLKTYFKRHNEKYPWADHPDTTFYAKFNDFFYWEQKAEITVGKEFATGDLFYVDGVRYEVRAMEVTKSTRSEDNEEEEDEHNGDGEKYCPGGLCKPMTFKYITFGTPLPKCDIDTLLPDDRKISSQWIDCITPGEKIPVLPPFNTMHNIVDDINVVLWGPLKHLDKWPYGDPNGPVYRDNTEDKMGIGDKDHSKDNENAQYFPEAERYLTMQEPPDEWLKFFRAVPIDSDRDMNPLLPTDWQIWDGPYRPGHGGKHFDEEHWVAYDVDEREIMNEPPMEFYYHEEKLEPRYSTNLLEVLDEKFYKYKPPYELWTKFDIQTLPDQYTEFKLPDVNDSVLKHRVSQMPDMNITKPGDYLLTTSLMAKNSKGKGDLEDMNYKIPRVALAYDVEPEMVNGQSVGDGLDIYVNDVEGNTVRIYGENDYGVIEPYDDKGQYHYKDWQDPFDPAAIRKDSITFNPAKILWDGNEFPMSADSINADLKKYLRMWYEPDHQYTKPEYHSRGMKGWEVVNGTIEIESTYLLTDRQDELPLSGPAMTTYFPFPIVSIPGQPGVGGFENPMNPRTGTPKPDVKNLVKLADVKADIDPYEKTVDGTIDIEKTYTMAVGDTVQFLNHKLTFVGVTTDSKGDSWAKVTVDYTGNDAFGSDSAKTVILGEFDDGTPSDAHAKTWFKRHQERYGHSDAKTQTIWYARFENYFEWEQKAEITVGMELETGLTFYVNHVRYDVGAIEVTRTGDGKDRKELEFKYITIKTPLPKCAVSAMLPDDAKASSQWIKCYEPNETLPVDPPFNMNHTIVDDINIVLWGPLKHNDKWPYGDPNGPVYSEDKHRGDSYAEDHPDKNSNAQFFPEAERYLTMQEPPEEWLRFFRAVPLDTDRDMEPLLPTDWEIWDGPYLPRHAYLTSPDENTSDAPDMPGHKVKHFDEKHWIAYDVDERYVKNVDPLVIKYVHEKMEPRYSTNLLEILCEEYKKDRLNECWTKFDIQTLPDQYTEFLLPEIPDLEVFHKQSQMPDLKITEPGDYLITTSFLAKNSKDHSDLLDHEKLKDHDKDSLDHKDLYLPRYAFVYDAEDGKGVYINEQTSSFPGLPNFPPTASFTTNTDSVEALAPVTVDATGTQDAEENDYPMNLEVDWGDGSSNTQMVGDKGDAIPVMSHSYIKRGSKDISLVACDKSGCSDPFIRTVTVQNDAAVLNLKQGWNAVSFPVIGDSRNPDDIFGGPVDLWHFTAADGWHTASTVVDGEGYLIYLTADRTVNLKGDAVSLTRDSLIAGLESEYNLVGTGAETIDMTGTSYVGAWYNSDTSMSDDYILTKILEPGKGYWIVK